jgi:hypothetical protein
MHIVKDNLKKFERSGDESSLQLVRYELGKISDKLGIPYRPSLREIKDDYRLLDDLRKFYIKAYNESSARKERITAQLIGNNKSETDKLMDLHTNESLGDMVLNVSETNPVYAGEREIIRRFRPVYMDGPEDSFRSPYFVSGKSFFGRYFSTYSVNCIVIWIMTLVLAWTLYINLFRKLLSIRR